MDQFEGRELGERGTVSSVLHWRGEHQSERTAFIFLADGERESARLTYGELDRQARSVAAWLQERELAGKPVILTYRAGLDFIVGFLGCLYAGAIAVPAYPPHPRRTDPRLLAILDDCAPEAALCVLADTEQLSRGLADRGLQVLATDALTDRSGDWRATHIEPESVAHLQYTSGSTGSPKGVMITHGNLLHQCEYAREVSRCNVHSTEVSWQPFFHDMGLIAGLVGPTFCGALTVVMSPAAFLQSPIRWLRAISNYRGTGSSAPNFAYDLCVRGTTPSQREGLDLSSWEMTINGAEPVRADTLDRFSETFEPYGFRRRTHLPCYGMAETTLCTTAGRLDQNPVVTCFRRDRLDHGAAETCAPEDPLAMRLVSSGIAGGSMEVAIVDPETLQRRTEDSVGEIWVSGPSVARGYWKRPEETEITFNARIAGEEKPYLRTGDLGFLREGELYVTGRLKDMIIVRGRNLYPQDIELVAQRSHDALQIDACAAFALDVEGREELAVALEVKRSGRQRVVPDEVFEAVRTAIGAEFGVAVLWLGLVQPGRIPKTSSGKIMRYACRQEHSSGALALIAEWRAKAREQRDSPAPDAVAGLIQLLRALPRTDRHRVLVAHVQGEIARALELAALPDPRAGFERLGLDSVGAVDLVNRLQDAIGNNVSLPATLLFDQPNIEALARYLEGVLFGEPTRSAAPARAGRLPDEPVAIVGLACRFPGAADADEFWRLLEEGRDAIREVPPERWNIEAYFDPDAGAVGKMNSRFGGFIDDIEGFDAPFFDISPREATSMDPQHRHLLEVAWLALEHAGIPPGRLDGRPAGVFMGISTGDYERILTGRGPETTDAFMATGNAHSAAVGRLSFALGLQGPCVAVDTACSSSLVAVHQAVQSLRQGECEIALAGGVNAILRPELTVAFCKARLLSPDGRCRTFDASADGYVRSEGCGIVVLKRLSDARRDGDRILAVIRGSAVNQDGRSSGLTAPSGPSQTRVIADALSVAGLEPASVQYLECHGTATVLGDPIEVQAASAILAQGREPGNDLVIGSVKSNVGHLEAAAGIAGLIKVVLALQHGAIPRSLHFKVPNPHIPWASMPVKVAAQTLPWATADSRTRIAGVSSFGFAGTNAHVVLEEAPRHEGAGEPTVDASGPWLLALSARTQSGVKELAGRYAAWLRARDDAAISEVCDAANTGRNHFEQRAVLICGSREAALQKLDALAQGKPAPGLIVGTALRERRPRVAFLFPGQGLQYAGMARELYERAPAFRECVDRCAAAYDDFGREDGSPPLKTLMFDPASTELLKQTRYVQPALYALQVSLAALWRSWGVDPDALLGHSAGEYAAACVAGVFRVEDGLRLIVDRARLMQTLPEGTMLSVTAPVETVEAVIAGDDTVHVSAYNGLNTVISGPIGRLDALAEQFDSKELYYSKLPASNAFHSPAIEPILEDYEVCARRTEYAAPHTRLISTMTGKPVAHGEIPDATYWRNQARQPVRFAQGIRALFEEVGCDITLELGPQAELIWLAQMSWRPEHPVLWASSLAKGRNAYEQILTAAAQIHARGITLDFANMAPRARRKHVLPPYPFQHERYWAGPMGGDIAAALGDCLYQVRWEVSTAAVVSSSVNRPQRWLILASDTELGAALEIELQARGQISVIRRTTGGSATSPAAIHAALEDARRQGSIDNVVHIAGPVLDPGADGDAVRDAQSSGVTSALLVAQALTASRGVTRLWLVTRGAQAVLDGEQVDPTHSPVWGFGRTFAVEHPDRYGGLIDLPLAQDCPEAAAALAGALLLDDGENQVAVRDGKTWMARFQRETVRDETPLRVRTDAAYLVTGGTGALGLMVARHLVERGAKQIVLTSRSGGSDAARAAIRALADSGCRIDIFNADASSPSQAEQLLERIEGIPDGYPLRGIVHAAGVLDGAPVASQTPELLASVMAPKVWGAWNLHHLAALRGIELDIFVLFSSAASLLGLRGHANYGAANAYLDGLAQHRRGKGLRAVAINWGPWADDGMATRMEAARWEEIGTRLIRPKVALRAFDFLAGGQSAQVCVQPMNLSRWADLARSGRLPPVLLKFLEALFPPVDESATAGDSARRGPKRAAGELIRRLAALGPIERGQALESHIRGRVGAVLGLAPENVDPEAGFFDLGMNSIMAVELRGALQGDIGDTVELQAAVIFNHPTVRRIAAYLSTALASGVSGVESAPVPVRIRDSGEARATALGCDATALVQAIDSAASEVLDPQQWPSASDESEENKLKRRALAAILSLQAEVDRLRARTTEPVAVIGLSCRYPGANDAEAFWRIFDEGRDEITEIPASRWDAATHYDADPDMPGKMNTRWGGFLSDVEMFDAGFFGISPREALSLDPQQRILLEVAWEALESAGLPPRRLRGARGGVFIGISVSDYAERVSRQDIGQLDAYAGTGNALCAAAGRLAFTLGWEGPALAIDTACSSSLVSLHEACMSLRAGECDIALAGGVSLVLNPAVSMVLSRAHMLSPDGRCKTFDTSANGYVRSEGCGVVALKRLADAERDGDPILALIRGSAVNQDGRSSGLTVPNGVAQERVITDALAGAGVAPADVQYLEAHGTGTPLGDPIEVQAADAVLSRGRDPGNPLLVGSAKSNIGHTETAAGIAGVIKVILALRHERIPKSLHYRTPNPHIPWDRLSLRIVAEPVPWPPGQRPRIADVSSFGFVGTNAHVVIEEPPLRRAPARADQSIPERDACVLALSARTSGALEELAARYLEVLARDGEVSLPDLCHSANTGRDHFEQRAALVFSGRERLKEQLTSLQQRLTDPGVHQGRLALRTTRRIAFLFTGQGSQFAGMGRELYTAEPAFRRHFDQCAVQFDRLLGGKPGLHDIVFEDDGSGRLDETRYTQPALYALETSLAALLRAWGIEPDVVLGHSVGEYAAAWAAGVFSLEDGMTLMVERGRLMQGLPSGGAMAAVSADARTVETAFRAGTDVCIAAYNGAETVISGASDTVDELLKRFEADGLRCKRLATSGAFHSAWMDPILEEFQAVASRIPFQLARKRLISNVSGDVVADGAVLDAAYWAEHVRKPVQFERGVHALQGSACDLVIELGPQPVLLGMGRRCWDAEREPEWVETLRRNRNDAEQIMTAVAHMYAGGVDVDFAAVDAPWRETRRRVSLPFYPFQRQRYWIDAPETRVDTAPNPQSCLYNSVWEQKAPPAVREHRRATWLILGDRGGIADVLCRQLEGLGQRWVCPPADEQVPWSAQTLARLFDEANAEESAPFGNVVHLRSLDGTRVENTDELRFAQKLGIESTLALTQALIRSSWRGKLWVVTRGVHQVTGSDRIEPAQGPMWGLGRAIAMEQPDLWGGLIDLPLDGDAAAVSAGLAQALLAGDDEDQIALRDGRRWVARVTRRQPPAATQPLEVAADGTYLITGGLGDLGLQMARRLVERGARNLVLTSRGMASDSAQETIADLVNKHGCTIRVIRADVSREADVSRLFGEIDASGLPMLKGIIHAAGVASLVPLENIDVEELERTLGPKVIGGWLLDRITRERGIKLAFFVCTASIASAWGAVSQAAYSAANAFLESLAESRKALGEAATTISYGPWAGLGLMASSTEQGIAWLRRRGLSLLGSSLALDAMESLMVERVALATVADVNWTTFRVHAEAQRPCPWLGHLGQTADTEADDSASRSNALLAAQLERLSSAPEAERIQLLATTIRTEISQVLGVHPQSLEDETSIFELGLDSLMAVDLINRLRRRLRNTQFTPRLIYDNPSVAALAAAVGREFASLPGGSARAELPPGAGSASRPPDPSPPAELARTEEAQYRTRNGTLYTYRRYRDGDRTGVLPSYVKCFGQKTASLLDSVFDWKYLDRPDQSPVVDILESSGEIVGWNGALPIRFKIEGETMPGVWSTDTHVAPEHRAVTGWFLHQVDESTPGLKLGMPNEIMYSIASATESVVDLDRLQNLRTCLDLAGVLRARGANALLCRVSGLLYWPVPRAIDFYARLRADRSVTVARIPRFDGRFDELWRTACRDYPGIMVRDQAFLSWRFDRCPNRGYARYAAEREGAVVGYLVTREFQLGNELRGRIVDYLVSRDDTRAFDALLRAAVRDFRSRGAVSVICSVASTRSEHIEALRRHGFLHTEPGARVVTSRGPQESKLAAIGDWFFTHADGDIDYCDDESET